MEFMGETSTQSTCEAFSCTRHCAAGGNSSAIQSTPFACAGREVFASGDSLASVTSTESVPGLVIRGFVAGNVTAGLRLGVQPRFAKRHPRIRSPSPAEL